jgi:hypothetical protein
LNTIASRERERERECNVHTGIELQGIVRALIAGSLINKVAPTETRLGLGGVVRAICRGGSESEAVE